MELSGASGATISRAFGQGWRMANIDDAPTPSVLTQFTTQILAKFTIIPGVYEHFFVGTNQEESPEERTTALQTRFVSQQRLNNFNLYL